MTDSAVYDSFVEIGAGCYWVGAYDKEEGLHCNPYLIVSDGEGILIDPGSVLDYERVLAKITQIIPLEKISYIVLNHQDPDLCSAVPLLEKAGFQGEVATYWRTAVLLKFYGITSRYYLVNEHDYELSFKSGRKLQFLQAPYLHFPGSIMTYDPQTKILFSSDVFGGFTHNWELWANGNYMEAMKVFHENYMPSNDIMRPVMEMLLNMDIVMIAPQHGSIIKADVKKHIKTLRDLECGAFLNPLKKELTKSGGFTSVVNRVLKRYYSTFDKKEVIALFDDTDIVINRETGVVEDYNCTGDKLWNLLFDIIFAKKGMGWVSIVETLVSKLTYQYDIPFPSVFESQIFDIEKRTEILASENQKLKELNDRLVSNLHTAQEKLMKCPVTGIYNASFFRNYLKAELANIDDNNRDSCLMVIDLDGFSKLSFKFGYKIEEEMLQNMAYLLKQFKQDTHVLFKLESASFAYYLPDAVDIDVLSMAESLRNMIGGSDIFVAPVTASIGLVRLSELMNHNLPENEITSLFLNTALLRLSMAKGNGMNQVCHKSEIQDLQLDEGTVVIADTEQHHAELLSHLLSDAGITVHIAADGEQAIEMIESFQPDIIVSETMLPKIDGFAVREKLLSLSNMQSIPYILTSYQKDEISIGRSLSLGIEHYFQKPYILSELVGIIKNKIKQRI